MKFAFNINFCKIYCNHKEVWTQTEKRVFNKGSARLDTRAYAATKIGGQQINLNTKSTESPVRPQNTSNKKNSPIIENKKNTYKIIKKPFNNKNTSPEKNINEFNIDENLEINDTNIQTKSTENNKSQVHKQVKFSAFENLKNSQKVFYKFEKFKISSPQKIRGFQNRQAKFLETTEKSLETQIKSWSQEPKENSHENPQETSINFKEYVKDKIEDLNIIQDQCDLKIFDTLDFAQKKTKKKIMLQNGEKINNESSESYRNSSIVIPKKDTILKDFQKFSSNSFSKSDKGGSSLTEDKFQAMKRKVSGSKKNDSNDLEDQGINTPFYLKIKGTIPDKDFKMNLKKRNLVHNSYKIMNDNKTQNQFYYKADIKNSNLQENCFDGQEMKVSGSAISQLKQQTNHK